MIEGLVVSLRDVTTQERELVELLTLQQQLRDAHEVARLASGQWLADGDEVLLFHAPPEAGVFGGAACRPGRFAFSGGERWLETRSCAVRAGDGCLISAYTAWL